MAEQYGSGIKLWQITEDDEAYAFLEDIMDEDEFWKAYDED